MSLPAAVRRWVKSKLFHAEKDIGIFMRIDNLSNRPSSLKSPKGIIRVVTLGQEHRLVFVKFIFSFQIPNFKGLVFPCWYFI